MTGKSFEVVYDDFSGGHYVGNVGTKQPKNTFIGYNITPSQYDGCLMAMETPYTLTSTLAIDTAANSTRPLYMARNSTLVWAGNTHAYSVTLSNAAPPLTVNSVATAFPAATFAATPEAGPRYFEPTSEVLYLASGSANLLRINAGASVANTNAIPATCSYLICWDQFVLAAQGRRIYFSNPGTATTWTGATDFFDIGSSVHGWCVHQGNLFIATANGWYVATGIPGATLSVRQITTTDSGFDPVSIDTTVLTTSARETELSVGPVNILNGPIVRELAGNRTRALNWSQSPDGRPPTFPSDGVKHGEFVIFTGLNQGSVTDEGGATLDLGTTIWILNSRTGTWVRRQIPSPETLTATARGITDSDLLIYRRTAPTDNHLIARLNSPDLLTNQDGTWPSATADLAEYYHNVPFMVKEVVCEVDYGTPGIGLSTNNRSVGVAVKTPGVLIENETDLAQSRAATSTQTLTLPPIAATGANYSRRRSFVRFSLTDGSDTYTIIPSVTLQGVKLRRLIVKCVEVG